MEKHVTKCVPLIEVELIVATKSGKELLWLKELACEIGLTKTIVSCFVITRLPPFESEYMFLFKLKAY